MDKNVKLVNFDHYAGPGPSYFGAMFGILFGPGGLNFMAMQAHLDSRGYHTKMSFGHGGKHGRDS